MKKSASERYAWVIVAATFFTLFFNPGLTYTAGVIHMRLVEIFPQHEYAVPWVGSVLCCMHALCGPLASIVINVSDCRTGVILSGVLGLLGFVGAYFARSLMWIFVAYSLITGLAQGLSYTSAVVILGYYFKENTSLAVGLAVTGAGLAMFVYPPLTDFLLTTYGLHGTFLILGGLVFQCCVCGMLLRPSKFERDRQLEFLKGRNKKQQIIHTICGGDRSQCHSIATNVPFLLLVLSYLTVSMATSTIYLYLPDYFLQNGASHQIASFSISVSGIGSVISRFLSGFAANHPQIGSLLLFACMTGINGIFASFVIFFSASSTGQLFYGFLLGLYTGGVWVVCGPITLNILGAERLATGFGVLMLTIGTGYLIGPPLAGLVFQATNEYYSVFLFAAVMCFISTLCAFLTALTKNKINETEETSINDKEKDVDVVVYCSNASLRHDKNYLGDEKNSDVIPEQEKLITQCNGIA